MIDRRDRPPRRRLAGLLASSIAVVALAVTGLAGNRSAGFGHTVTHGEQMFLFAIALLLLAAQAVAYLIHQMARPNKRGREQTTTAARVAKH